MARTRLSFSSCNLYNINLPGHRIYSDSDGWSQEIYNKKVEWTARIISALEADVWGFQELWHQQALSDIFDRSGLRANYELLVPEGHSGQYIVCGAAVRKDIIAEEATWIEKFPEKFILRSGGDDAQTSDISVLIDSFSRPVLHFGIRPRSDGKTISVYVVHFKSKSPTQVYREGW